MHYIYIIIYYALYIPMTQRIQILNYMLVLCRNSTTILTIPRRESPARPCMVQYLLVFAVVIFRH